MLYIRIQALLERTKHTRSKLTDGKRQCRPKSDVQNAVCHLRAILDTSTGKIDLLRSYAVPIFITNVVLCYNIMFPTRLSELMLNWYL